MLDPASGESSLGEPCMPITCPGTLLSHWVGACLIGGCGAGVCASDPNKDFPWNVERSCVLAKAKHAARVLVQGWNPSARLAYVLWSLCPVFALVSRTAQKMALDGQRCGFLTCGDGQLCLTAPPSTHSSAPRRAGIFVFITHVSFKAFLMNVRKLI